MAASVFKSKPGGKGRSPARRRHPQASTARRSREWSSCSESSATCRPASSASHRRAARRKDAIPDRQYRGAERQRRGQRRQLLPRPHRAFARSSSDLDQSKLPKGVKGVFVLSVADKSPARSSALKPQDIITEVNEKPISTAKEFYAAVNDPSAKKIAFTVIGTERRFRRLPTSRSEMLIIGVYSLRRRRPTLVSESRRRAGLSFSGSRADRYKRGAREEGIRSVRRHPQQRDQDGVQDLLARASSPTSSTSPCAAERISAT